MYQLLLCEQCFSIGIIVLGMIKLLYSKTSRLQVMLEILLAGILINQAGYLVEMTATTQAVAISAVKIAYIGKLIAELLTFLFVMEYCDRKIPTWICHALMSVHAIVIALVWGCNYTSLYYSSIDFVDDGLFPHLVLGHGIAYQIFTVFTFSYMFIMIAACIRSLIHAQDKFSRRKILVLLSLPILSILSLLLFKMNAFKGYDGTTLAYTVDAILLVYAITKYNLTDPVKLAKDTIVDEFMDAVLVIKSNREIQYSNTLAKKLFKGNKEIDDKHISESMLHNFNHLDNITIGDRIYDISKRVIAQKGWDDSTVYVFIDRTENYKYTRMLEEKAHCDELTHAYNRRALISAFESDLEVNVTYVALLDIDNFKGINDTYGHNVGDECLILLTQKLHESFAFEEVFRFGGDEFVLITRKEDLLKRLTAINDFLKSDRNPHPFTISGGCIKYQKGMDDRSIITTADKALYKKKQGGKGGFVMLDELSE